MKKTLLALGLVMVCSGQAAAATDHNWTGGYLGLNMASNKAESQADLALSGQWSVESSTFRDDVTDAWETSLDSSGIGFGIQAGYDYQFSNDWVLGFSVEYSDLNSDKARLTPQTAMPSAPSVTYSFGNSIDVQNSWGLKSRVGYAFDNSLFYFTLGWTSADVQATAEIFSGSNGYSKFGMADDSVSGTTYGIGLEYAFTDNWSMQFEYLHTDLGDFEFTTAYRPGSTFTSPAYIETFNQDLEINSFRIGLNYRF